MINDIDKSIQEAAEKAGIDWALAVRTHEGIIFTKVRKFPALIQFIEDVERVTDSGMVEQDIDFYILADKATDASAVTIRQIHGILSKKVNQFQSNLRSSFLCEFVGNKSKYIDQIRTVMEVGIQFRLRIKYDVGCL